MKHTHILAIASAGGHWVQLQRLRPAWDECRVTYVTTQAGYERIVAEDALVRGQDAPGYYVVTDANRWQKIRLVKQLFEILFLMVKLRPDVVISTGAAPGFFALKFGKLIGARTIWVDSIANAEVLSLSGQKAGAAADLWLTQWAHLGSAEGQSKEKPGYEGSVI